MQIFLVLLLIIWLIVNIVVICASWEDNHCFEIDRHLSVGDILAGALILPIAVLVWHLVRAKPLNCLMNNIKDMLDYKPFDKK
jgi:hypothetical protein